MNDTAFCPSIADTWRDRGVLVTGASGFVGGHLAATLLAAGARVRLMVRDPARLPAHLSAAQVVVADLERPASLAAAVKDREVVFHAAGFAHVADGAAAAALHYRVNAEGSRHLLQVARESGVSRFVLFSSVKASGGALDRCIDEDWPLPPDTPYGRAKRAAEESLFALCQAGMEGVVLRPALVYGPGGRGNLTRMIRLMRRGLLPPLPEVGNRRSMVHVDDLVQAALLAGASPRAVGRLYIVTDGHDYSGREIQSLIRQALGRPSFTWSTPEGLLRALARVGNGIGRLSGRSADAGSRTLDRLLGWACYSNSRLVGELGFTPRHRLSQALPAMVEADRAGRGDRWS